jgi:Flp pilus assembly protein TadG
MAQRSGLSRIRRFPRDRQGGVIVWLALVAPVLAALCALSVDVARIYNLEAELQTAADAMARAGAVELDGDEDAIERADAAITSLLSNNKRFANIRTGAVQVQRTRYLSSLPISDADPVTAAYETTEPENARYVEVTVLPQAITTLFPPKISAGLVSVSLSAKAIGGRMAQMCGAAPVFICNPVENDSTWELDRALNDPSFRGRQLQLRGKSGSSAYAPGQFGFLEPPVGGKGASDMKDYFAEVSPATCYAVSGVTLRTGIVSSVSSGVNTRFGEYSGNYRGQAATYPAAPIVTSYPQDNCFATGACTRLGDGSWNVVEYMRTRHGAPASAEIGGQLYYFNYAARTVSPGTPPRYQVYRWEIEKAGGVPPSPDNDRRVLPVAVLNCAGENLTASKVPVASFAKVFLTESMNEVIWGELVGGLQWGVDRQARDQVDVRR